MAKKTSPRSFAQRLRAFADDIPKQQNEIKKEFARECLVTVIGDTPVDTGQARGNWIVTIDSKDDKTLLPGPFGPSKYSARSGYSTKGSKTRGGDQAITLGLNKIRTVKPGQKIELQNNLPYIARLDEGYSSQAPANFFKIAIEKARAIIKRQKIRYGVK